MKNIAKIYVGVDVSKKKLDVHLMPVGKALSVANTSAGIKKLLQTLENYEIGQVVCEASGGYELAMIQALKEKEITTWCVEPKRIKAFIYSEGKRAKTDAIDAQMIALFASQKVNPHPVVYEKNRKLNELVARKKDLITMIGMEKSRLQMPQNNCKNDIKKHIAFMQKQVKSLGINIDMLIKNDAELNAKSELLQSVPGVGKTSAAIILAEVPELGNIGNKEIASLLGVAPHPYESGQFKGKRRGIGGRYLPRSILFMVALVASRYNKIFKAFYQRLLKAGKMPKVALGAIMRKMIVLFNVMVKNKTPWNENIA